MFELPQWVTAESLRNWLPPVVLVIVILLVVNLLQRTVTRHLHGGVAAHRVRRFLRFSGYLIAALVLLSAFSSRLTGLTVALGVAGAGIAFALQEVIASVAGWVAVTFGRFYAIGDRVQLGGIKGDVIDIGVLRTTLMEVGEWVAGDLYNGRIVRIANSFVFKEPVFNYSADYPFLWDEIKIPIRYGSDWQHARASATAWQQAREKYALENARIEPLVSMILTDNWIELTGRYVVDYRRRRLTKDALAQRFLAAVDESQGRIRLASTTVELVNLADTSRKIGDASV
ncbi:MAG: mechanosensitive ion channel [Steroidobacteraceae bacterium]